MISQCMECPPKFNTVDDIVSEYLCLPNEDATERVFGVRATPFGPEDNGYLMANYWKWSGSVKIPRPHQDLLDRTSLEKWLYQLLFKLLLPAHPGSSLLITQTPLNFGSWFRIIGLLHKQGYPAHWLVNVLKSVVSNTITTSARPPRTNPLRPEELIGKHPVAKADISPFMAQIRTIFTQLIDTLPFGIAIPPAILPNVDVLQYNFSFNETGWVDGHVAVLLFWNPKILSLKSLKDAEMYDVLLWNGKGPKDALLTNFRSEALAIFDCFIILEENIAKVWVAKNEMKKMEDWSVAIFRTEIYELVSDPVPVRSARTDDLSWNEMFCDSDDEGAEPLPFDHHECSDSPEDEEWTDADDD